MTASDVRHRARADHDRLRQRLDALARTAGGVLQGDCGAGHRELDRRLEALRAELARHLRWEDREVPRVLSEADAWGAERVARLRAAHRELEAVLDWCRHACEGESHPVVRARRARDLVALLRRELDAEERVAVRHDVLRDDVVTIGQVSG